VRELGAAHVPRPGSNAVAVKDGLSGKARKRAKQKVRDLEKELGRPDFPDWNS